MAKDYYKILGVNKTASQDEIKRAFRKLAHQHHPDKAGGNEQKFKEINEAYQVLSNSQKRQQYDQFGSTFEQARSQGGFGGFNDFASAFRNSGGASFDFGAGDLGDIFGDLFGFGGNRSRGRAGSASSGADIEAEITIDFREAVFGSEKTITLTKDETCSRCQGSGAEPGSKINTCPECKGTGQVLRSIGFGISFNSVCPACGGQGQKAEKDCSVCHGGGIEKKTRQIKVKIPAGIDNGQMIRLSGEGQSVGRSGKSGDLYLRIKVTPDREFKRDGYDILTEAQISFSQAALGDKVSIDTLDGKVKLKVTEGTQSGKVFRLRGRGVPHVQGRGRGDQLVRVIVKTPTDLSRKQKELLKELEKESI